MFEFALFLIFPAAIAFAGAMDLFTMTIPNRISLALIASFFVAAAFMNFSWWDIASHIAAGSLMLTIGFFMFARGWIGGGDAKLLAVIALWLGFERLPDYLLLATMAGGLLALALLTYRSYTPPLWLCSQSWAMRLHHRNCGIPYGIALAIAGLWIYPSTYWFSTLAV